MSQPALRTRARRFYWRHIRGRIANELHRQRLKLLWFVWGYRSVLRIHELPLRVRLRLVARFLQVDWYVEHGHRPSEVGAICQKMAVRGEARGDEIFVEAGCWNGGSSAKFSLLCAQLGYWLHIYDSFQGVEPLTAEEKAAGGHDYSGEYAAPEAVVSDNLARFGRPEICQLHKGWFADTLAGHSPALPVAFVYIDCDIAKGTQEVLEGVVPVLAPDAVIFSQDYHIPPVRRLLHDPATWQPFGKGQPVIRLLVEQLAMIVFISPPA